MTIADFARLRLFLYGLPIRDRQVLVMHYADGLSEQEIGLVMDLPDNTIRPLLEHLKRQAQAVLATNSDDAPAQAVA